MRDTITFSTAVIAITLIGIVAITTIEAQEQEGCRPTTVCVLDEAATARVFVCMQEAPSETPWSGEDVASRQARSCITAHEATCARERGFVCKGDQPLPCTLAFDPQEVAACAP